MCIFFKRHQDYTSFEIKFFFLQFWQKICPPSIYKSEKVLLLKDTVVPGVNRIVIVNKRFLLRLLRLELVHVLPGCVETNQGNFYYNQQGRYSLLDERNTLRCLLNTFIDEEGRCVEASPDCGPRVWDVGTCPHVGRLLRMPLSAVEGVVVRWRRTGKKEPIIKAAPFSVNINRYIWAQSVWLPSIVDTNSTFPSVLVETTL